MGKKKKAKQPVVVVDSSIDETFDPRDGSLVEPVRPQLGSFRTNVLGGTSGTSQVTVSDSTPGPTVSSVQEVRRLPAHSPGSRKIAASVVEVQESVSSSSSSACDDPAINWYREQLDKRAEERTPHLPSASSSKEDTPSLSGGAENVVSTGELAANPGEDASSSSSSSVSDDASTSNSGASDQPGSLRPSSNLFGSSSSSPSARSLSSDHGAAVNTVEEDCGVEDEQQVQVVAVEDILNIVGELLSTRKRMNRRNASGKKQITDQILQYLTMLYQGGVPVNFLRAKLVREWETPSSTADRWLVEVCSTAAQTGPAEAQSDVHGGAEENHVPEEEQLREIEEAKRTLIGQLVVEGAKAVREKNDQSPEILRSRSYAEGFAHKTYPCP